MWTIIKFEKNKLSLVKNEFINKLGKEVSYYEPKFKITSYTKSKK